MYEIYSNLRACVEGIGQAGSMDSHIALYVLEHHEEVPQVAIPAHAAHLREGETLDRGMFVAVARTVIAARDGIGTHLHHAERRGRPRKGLAQTVVCSCRIDIRTRSDKRIHILRDIGLGAAACGECRSQRPRRKERRNPDD